MIQKEDELSQTNLIAWYRNERRRVRGNPYTICECECGSGAPLSSSDPDLLRCFIYVASSIEQAMRVSVRPSKFEEESSEYADFRKEFPFPRIESHGGEITFVSPECLIYSFRGKKVLTDWQLCSRVAENLIIRVKMWIASRPNPIAIWTGFHKHLAGFVSTFEAHDSTAAKRVLAVLQDPPD